MQNMAMLAGIFLCMDVRTLWGRDLKEIKRDGFISLQEAMNKDKPFKCSLCKYSPICQGVCRAYKQVFSADELMPLKGKKILKPYHFYEEQVSE